MVEYNEKPWRVPDPQYRHLLQDIISQGETVSTRHDSRSIMLMQRTMKFQMKNGFPMITERDVSGFWQKPIGELCAFINGATTIKELESFGCDWWKPWATQKKSNRIGRTAGNLGPGSYGGAFAYFPTNKAEHDPFAYSETRGGLGQAYVETFDQFENIVPQIMAHPDDRTHFITPWVPSEVARGIGDYMPGATIAPCHGWVHIRVINQGLHLHMFQRSGDVPVGVPSNMIQYAALLLMLEHLTGFEAHTFYHTISDAHVYLDQVSKVEDMLEIPGGDIPFPKVNLTDEGRKVNNIKDFRGHHFALTEYESYPALNFPVSV